MGNVTEITTCEKQSTGSPCKKLNKDYYMDLRTGEVLEYDHSENRGDNLHGIRQTLSRIRALINTNVTEPLNCRWVTLTYRHPSHCKTTESFTLQDDTLPHTVRRHTPRQDCVESSKAYKNLILLAQHAKNIRGVFHKAV